MATEDETKVKEAKFQIAFNVKSAHSRIHDGSEDIISRILTEGINGERKWFLRIRPKEEGDYKDYVGMYLDLHEDSQEAEVEARYSFDIFNRCNLILVPDDSFTDKKFIRGRSPGYGITMMRDKLFDPIFPQYIVNDTLKILCRVEIKGESKSKVPKVKVIDDLEQAYNSKEFTDVKITCKGSVFHCSKAILAARSDVFRAMFSHNFKENVTGEVVVEDIEPASMELTLRFIYTGKFTFKSTAVTYEVLKAANKYCLDRLKIICEEAILAKLSQENAWELLLLARSNSMTHLEEGIIKKMNSRKPEGLIKVIKVQKAVRVQKVTRGQQ